MLQIVGNLASVLGKLDHHLLVQPHMHLYRTLRVALVVQFLRQVFPSGRATVRVKKLHQIDDGGAPLELLLFLFRQAVQDRSHVYASWPRGFRARCYAWR